MIRKAIRISSSACAAPRPPHQSELLQWTVFVRPIRAAANVKEIMKAPIVLLALAVTAVSGPLLASPELAQQKTCMACHATDKKIVGPSYKDVAAKYAGRKDAAALLAEKILKGGSGVGGAVPMPANPSVSTAEAQQLATWILSIK
jgi:cytochrome c